MDATTHEYLFGLLNSKSGLKLEVYDQTVKVMNLFKEVIRELMAEYHQHFKKQRNERPIQFSSYSRHEFEIELSFGTDTLLFLMHTNVFEFSRDHQIMRTSYIRQDKERSYCGMISIYNFLSDSFRYNRQNDLGYLIGRIFVNKENHFFTDGKHELGFRMNEFGSYIFDKNIAEKIVESAITYTINFDLLTPPYEAVKLITVGEVKSTLDAMPITTGKRLGFRFQQDELMDEN